MLTIKTDRITCSLPSRMNICIGTQDPLGRLLAPPSWDLVMGYKAGVISQRQYTKEYLAALNRRFLKWPALFEKILIKAEVILVCYCRKGAFCHRILAAEWLVKQFPERCTYMGEIR